MKKINVYDKKTKNLMMTVICYSKELFEGMLKIYQKNKKIEVEIEESESSGR